jgi:hypothetical protein
MRPEGLTTKQQEGCLLFCAICVLAKVLLQPSDMPADACCCMHPTAPALPAASGSIPHPQGSTTRLQATTPPILRQPRIRLARRRLCPPFPPAAPPHLVHLLLACHGHEGKALAAPREAVPVEPDVHDAPVAPKHVLQVLPGYRSRGTRVQGTGGQGGMSGSTGAEAELGDAG